MTSLSLLSEERLKYYHQSFLKKIICVHYCSGLHYNAEFKYQSLYIYIYIHSPVTLLGAPVQLLDDTHCSSANHMAAFSHLDVVKTTC